MSAKSPKCNIKSLFDHLVGTTEHRRRYHQTECLRGLEIDHKLILSRGLHRKVGRLLALEDAIDIASRPPELVNVVSPIGDQTARGDEEALEVDRR